MSPAGRLQGWLQHKPWPLWRLGNCLAELRYLLWNLKARKDSDA